MAKFFFHETFPAEITLCILRWVCVGERCLLQVTVVWKKGSVTLHVPVTDILHTTGHTLFFLFTLANFSFCFLDNLSSFPIHPGMSAGRNLELSGNKVTVGVLKISFLQNITKVCIHIILILKGESCTLFHNYVSVLCVSSQDLYFNKDCCFSLAKDTVIFRIKSSRHFQEY